MQRTIIRRKALDSIMKAPPAHPVMKKAELPTSNTEMDDDKEGYVSMMVTPEEKQMILDMRQKEESGETPHQEQVEVEQVKE